MWIILFRHAIIIVVLKSTTNGAIYIVFSLFFGEKWVSCIETYLLYLLNVTKYLNIYLWYEYFLFFAGDIWFLSRVRILDTMHDKLFLTFRKRYRCVVQYILLEVTIYFIFIVLQSPYMHAAPVLS